MRLTLTAHYMRKKIAAWRGESYREGTPETLRVPPVPKTSVQYCLAHAHEYNI